MYFSIKTIEHGGGSVNCADSLQRALGHCHFDVVDMVPCRRQTLDLKLKVLRVTGKWFAGYGIPALN